MKINSMFNFFKKKNNKSWKDITLSKFNKYLDLLDNKDEYTYFNIIDLIYDVDSQSLPVSELNKFDISFLSKEIPTTNEIPNAIKINKHKYTIDAKLTDINTAQFIDYQNYTKNKFKYEDILSIIIVPKGHSYNDGYDMDVVKRDLLELPIPLVYSIAFFFKSQLRLYVQIFQIYLKSTIEKSGISETEIKKIMDQITKWESLNLE